MDIIVSVYTCRCVSVIEYILYILLLKHLKWFSCFSQANISMHRTRNYSLLKCFCKKYKSVLAKISVIILQCIMYLEQINKFHKT